MRPYIRLFDFQQRVNYGTELLSGLTVALALVASVTQLLPDITAQSADALSHLPDGLDRALAAAAIK